MRFEDFKTIGFPPPENCLLSRSEGIVYVFCYVTDGEENPFYVGQTNRLSGRMRDYFLANFAACTDFCVGEAVRYLKDVKGFSIKVKYKPSLDPPRNERMIIRDLLVSGIRLLNCLPRYDYRTDNAAEQRNVLHSFCDMLISTVQGAPSGR